MIERRNIFFVDLTHTSQGVVAPTFPLGISFVASYAQKVLGPGYRYELFKFPHHFNAALQTQKPAFLCFSNYSWNFELAYRFAEKAKARWGDVVTVFGGPNFPIDSQEKTQFLLERPAIDFYVEMEGELGFVNLVQQLEDSGLDLRRFKATGRKIQNTCYLADGTLINGPVERIVDIGQIPSPYLTGLLDPFFNSALAPLLETTRGCPFSCAFCADGLALKSKIRRFEDGRTAEELDYIAKRVRQSDEIIITDLNFGMFDHDLETCRLIADLQKTRDWPVLVKASAGKNKPERVIEAASILKGSWMIGSAIQSSDAEVLKAVKRGNISSESFSKFIDYGNSISEEALTYTDIILGLPADTKEKHFNSLRYGIDRKVNSLRMYQTVLLMGTELASPFARQLHGLDTRFRVLPGCAGVYPVFDEDLPVAEIEEIIVATKTMPFSEYVDCRKMNLILETFYNNALFEEVFACLSVLDLPVFDAFLYLAEHPELQPAPIAAIFDSFVEQTVEDLFDGHKEAKDKVLSPGTVEKYVRGELGINELLVHKARLYLQLEASSVWFRSAIQGFLEEKGKLTPAVDFYLGELFRFLLLRKHNVTLTEESAVEYFHFDFAEIARQRYAVDPNRLERTSPRAIRFFHDARQKHHIEVQYEMYSKTATGLGRFIQRCNLKMMYRRFETAAPARNDLAIAGTLRTPDSDTLGSLPTHS